MAKNRAPLRERRGPQGRKPRVARTAAPSPLDNLKLSDLAARQAAMEIQLSKLRMDYEIQFVRIAQLQDELNTLKGGSSLGADALIALPPLPAKPTVES
jgi:hypothetical protein